jgi:hypothetical protein
MESSFGNQLLREIKNNSDEYGEVFLALDLHKIPSLTKIIGDIREIELKNDLIISFQLETLNNHEIIRLICSWFPASSEEVIYHNSEQ